MMKTALFPLFFLVFSSNIIAQSVASDEIIIAPMLSVSILEGGSSIRSGEKVVLKTNGGDAFSTLQWQMSLDNKVWQNIPKANGNNFETATLTQTHFFRVLCRPIDGITENQVETVSNVQTILLEENVASTKK